MPQIQFLIWALYKSLYLLTYLINIDACHQRSAAYERQIEQLRQQLTDAVQGTITDSRTQEPAADMQQAIDILKRSSLEVELAAKEGEVRCRCFSSLF